MLYTMRGTALRQFECNEGFRFLPLLLDEWQIVKLTSNSSELMSPTCIIDFSITLLCSQLHKQSLSFEGPMIASLETCGHVYLQACDSAFPCEPLGQLIILIS